MAFAEKKQKLYELTAAFDSLAQGALNTLKYDGIPLWWFYKIRFMRDALPSQFDNFERVLQLAEKNAVSRFVHLKKQQAAARMLARTLAMNERLKCRWAPAPQHIPGDILFLVHTIALEQKGNELVIDRMQCVYNELKKKKSVSLLVVDPLSAPAQPALGRWPHLIYAHMTREIRENAGRKAAELHAAWEKIRPNFEKAGTEKNRAYFPFFMPALDFFFSREMSAAMIVYYETFRKIIRESKKKALLIYSPAGVIDRCAIAAADRSGIPTIRLTHGMGISTTPWTYPKSFYLLANNEIEKQRYAELGAPPENITITGPVFLEKIEPYLAKRKKQNITKGQDKRTKQKNKTRQKQNKKPVILFCTAPIVQENIVKKDRYFAAMKKYLADLAGANGGNARVILKLHPIEKYHDAYAAAVNAVGGQNRTNIEIVKGTLGKKGKKNLYDLISECDVFVSFFSTTLFEANLLGKPTILITLYDWSVVDNADIFQKNSDAVVKIEPDYADNELRAAVERVLHDAALQKKLAGAQKTFVEKFFYKVDGKAPLRAVRAIEKIVRRHQTYALRHSRR